MAGGLLAAGGQARRRHRFRGGVRLRRRTLGGPGSARHRIDHTDRGRHPCWGDRTGDRSARARRRRHRIRRADECGPDRRDAGGRRPGRLSSRGSGEPQAVRAPRRQGRGPRRRHAQATGRSRERPARRELRHLCAHRCPRDRGSRRGHRSAPDHRRRRHATQPRAGPRCTTPRFGLRGELPEYVFRGGARPGNCPGIREVDGALRRTQFQCIHLRRARRDLDPVGYLQCRDRGDRRAEGVAARRRQRGGHVRHDRDRPSRTGPGMARRQVSSGRRRSWASVTACTRTAIPGCRR